MKELVFFTLIVLFLVFSVRRATKVGLLLSPHSSMVLVCSFSIFFPSILYFDILSNDYHIFSAFVFISLVLFAVLCKDHHWMVRTLIRRKNFSISMSVINIFSFIYFIYLLVDILLLIKSHGGIVGVLSRDRLEDYLGGGIKSGSFAQVLFLVPSIAYFILIGSLLNKSSYKSAIFLILFLVFYYVLTANTRLPIIMPIAAFFVYLMFFKLNKFVSKYGVLLVSLSIFFVSLFSFFANLMRHGLTDIQGSVLTSMHEQNLNQLKYPIWIDDLIIKIRSEELVHAFGVNWFITPIVNIIPRALWVDKPITSTSNVLSEAVYNITVGDGSPITTFTIWGEAYWQFGLFGVFGAAFIFYFAFKLLARFYFSYKHTEFYMIYVLINWLPFIRAEMPFFYLMMSIIGLFMLVFFSYVVGLLNHSRSRKLC